MRLLQSIPTLTLSLLKRALYNSKRSIMSVTEDNVHNIDIETTFRQIYSQTDADDVRNLYSFSLTGGGAQFAHWSFTIPGASNCVFDGSIPYSRDALHTVVNSSCNTDFSGACNAETAVQMARAAYMNTVKYALQSDIALSSLARSNVFGLSCTAALVSDQPKRGAHRCHVSVYSASGCQSYSIEFNKLRGRTRVQEDHLCSRLMLDAAAVKCGVALRQGSPLQSLAAAATEGGGDVDEAVDIRSGPVSSALDSIDRVAARRATHTLFIPKEGEIGCEADRSPSQVHAAALESQFAHHECAPIPSGSIVYPGSFNPLHEGHVRLVLAEIERRRALAGDETGSSSRSSNKQPLVVFELAVANADKPSLPQSEVVRRLLQFSVAENPLLSGLRYAVCITSEPLFVGKSAVFRGSTFVIGADTFRRLIDSKYYSDSTAVSNSNSNSTTTSTSSAIRRTMSMVAALATIQNNGCTVTVGGRVPQGSAAPAECIASTAPSAFETMDVILAGSYAGSVLPASVAQMFTGLTESQFRLDISSTELRKRSKH